jgi:hypothetical protein
MLSETEIKRYCQRLGIDPEYLPTWQMREIIKEYLKDGNFEIQAEGLSADQNNEKLFGKPLRRERTTDQVKS